MSRTPCKILVVDDDARLRTLLKNHLTEHGLRVGVVADGIAMDKLLAREWFDLIVLDLMLPREDGLTICRRLRAANNKTPILMLTAKGSDIDRILGLEMGADDYLPKPFNPRELVARTQAILRRMSLQPHASALSAESVIRFGPNVLDTAQRSLVCNGEAVPLTGAEFALLKTLACSPRQALSRDKLARLAQGRDHDGMDRSIDVRISRLRRLIEVDTSRPRYIHTIWGFGYMFVPDNEPS